MEEILTVSREASPTKKWSTKCQINALKNRDWYCFQVEFNATKKEADASFLVSTDFVET